MAELSYPQFEQVIAAILTVGHQAGTGAQNPHRTVHEFWEILEEVRLQKVLLRSTEHPT